jgi:hypothetical protein
MAFRLARDAQEMRSLPEKVEADIGERKIDLQHRRMTAPFRKTLAEDEGIVTQPDRVKEKFVPAFHQMFFTFSGIE